MEQTAGVALVPEVKLSERSTMPDAEPLAETIEAGAADAAASEIVDVTDAAVAERTPSGTELDAAPDGIGVGGSPRRGCAAADRRDRFRKVGAIVFITVVVLGAPIPGDAHPQPVLRGSHDRGPRARTCPGAGAAIAGVTADTNVFTLDAGAAERRLERDPWIAAATVTKDLPSTLVIDVHERSRWPSRSRTASSARGRRRGVPRAALPPDAIGMPPRHRRCGGDGTVARGGRGSGATIAAMAPTLRRRIDGISISADGQLRSICPRGRARHTASRSSSRRKPMALRACWTTRRSVARPSSPWTSGSVGSDRGARGRRSHHPVNGTGCHPESNATPRKRLTDLRFLSSVPTST